MTGCGAAEARKFDECECSLPPGHPPPHRCDDCGLTWHERPSGGGQTEVGTEVFDAGPEVSGDRCIGSKGLMANT